MKPVLCALVISLFIIPSVLAEGISSVRVGESVEAGAELPVHISLPEETSWKGWIVIPELGIFAPTHKFESRGGWGYLFIPYEIPRGEYIVRVQVREEDSDSQKDSYFRHRWVSID